MARSFVNRRACRGAARAVMMTGNVAFLGVSVTDNFTWLDQVEDGQPVEGLYYLRAKSLSTTKSGKLYLTLRVSDRTTELEGRMWDNAELYDTKVQTGDFVLLQGRGSMWNDAMQIKVTHLETLPADRVDPERFLPVCPGDVDAYWRAIQQTVAELPAGPCRDLCAALLADDELAAGLRRAPAATGVHQAYIGGLLEHVCSMLLLAGKVCDHYPTLDRSLLAAGVLFHDIGKAREMSYELTLDYTDEGRLIGHLVFGAETVDRLAAQVGAIPAETATLVKHLVLSHHGRPEFGTVRVPMFAEAAVLHYLDNLDAKVFGFLEAEVEAGPGAWSPRKWFLETAVYKARPEPTGYRIALPGDKPTEKPSGKRDKKDDLPLFSK